MELFDGCVLVAAWPYDQPAMWLYKREVILVSFSVSTMMVAQALLEAA